MSLLADVVKELADMFWADRRLNLGLLAATGTVALAGWAVPSLWAGLLPILLALAYAGVIAWAIAPVDAARRGPTRDG